jgi:hypothetical protein
MTPFERWTVWLSAVLVTATGLAYFWMKHFLHPTDPFAVVNHPWQPAVLKLHILTAPLLVFGLGLVTVRHVAAHLSAGTRWGRRSGLSAVFSAAPLILTGYLIQALTDERWLRVVGWAHIGLGFAFAAGLLVHQVVVRGSGPVGQRVGHEITKKQEMN